MIMPRIEPESAHATGMLLGTLVCMYVWGGGYVCDDFVYKVNVSMSKVRWTLTLCVHRWTLTLYAQ